MPENKPRGGPCECQGHRERLVPYAAHESKNALRPYPRQVVGVRDSHCTLADYGGTLGLAAQKWRFEIHTYVPELMEDVGAYGADGARTRSGRARASGAALPSPVSVSPGSRPPKCMLAMRTPVRGELPDMGIPVYQPFAGLTTAELAARIDADAETARAALPELVSRMDALLMRHAPWDVLAHFTFYGLTSRDGTNEREFRERESVHLYYVELLQAFALRRAPGQFGRDLLRPAESGALFEAVRDLAQALRASRGRGDVLTTAGANAARAALVEAMRLETQAVRVPGYPQFTAAIVRDVFAPLDAQIERAHGVRVAGLVEVWATIGREVDRRMTAHMHRCRPFRVAARAGDVTQALAAFRTAFPDAPHAEVEPLVRAVSADDASASEGVLQAVADCELPEAFVVDLAQCVSAYDAAVAATTTARPADSAALARVLDGWALAFGDLAGHDPVSFALDNPVWRRPLVRLDEGLWFCALPTLFFSFPFELLDALVGPTAALRQQYERRRADYLEREVARLLAEALPGATVIRGSMWRDSGDGRDYEADALVLLDRHAVVVEVKSGAVSVSGRRGAPDRLRRHVRELMGEAAEQVSRGARHLEMLARRLGPHRLLARDGTEHTVELTDDLRVVPLVVTLDHLNLGGVGGRALVDAGWLPSAVGPVPALSLWDLRAVLTVLGGPAEVLHYFARRATFERAAYYQAYEMDLLGYYLEGGLATERIEDADGRRYTGQAWVVLAGHSRVVAPYLVAPAVEHLRGRVPRPRARRTPWFAAIVGVLELRRPPGWTRMAELLLNLHPDGQEALEEAVLHLRTSRGPKGRAHRRRQPASTVPQYPVAVNGPEDGREVLLALDLAQPTAEARRRALRDAVRDAAERYPGCPVLGIGLDPAYPLTDHPYRLLVYTVDAAPTGTTW